MTATVDEGLLSVSGFTSLRDNSEPISRDLVISLVKVRVSAKLNAYLRVGAHRPDGYHDLTTVFQSVDLFDELSAYNSNDLTVTVEGEGAADVPTNSQNLAIRAAIALADHTGRNAQVRLHITKNIPVGGGLGGGSADAAAALVACNILWKTGLDTNTLVKIGGSLGSDVPFQVNGMMALGTERGLCLSPIECTTKSWYWVLGILHHGLLTRDVYGMLDLDAAADKSEVCDPSDLIRWGHEKPQNLSHLLRNDLQNAAVSLLPELKIGLDAGSRADALASLITGSGSTCIFLARDHEHAQALAGVLAEEKTFRKVLAVTGPVGGVEVICISVRQPST
jgi:4-diphosphocytidyl-2-C-methyl-D-erythritol kinase